MYFWPYIRLRSRHTTERTVVRGLQKLKFTNLMLGLLHPYAAFAPQHHYNQHF